jgi:hypothetical protein
MQEDLRLRNLPERTIRRYTRSVAKFAKCFPKSPDHVRTFLVHRLDERKLAGRTVQGIRLAPEFLYSEAPLSNRV